MDLTVEAILRGEVRADEARVTAATLERQAAAAEAAGNPQLAENLRRGAELDAMAGELESRGAHRCAALVREARAAYLRRGLVT